MMWSGKQMVRVLVKGGILTPSYLLNITEIAKTAGRKYVHFGSRQDLLFEVDSKQMAAVKAAFDSLNISYITHGRDGMHLQNVVSSYVASDIMPSTPWITSGSFLFVLEHFNYQPMLRINIADPKQSLVPLFYGHLNFVASALKDYWFLYIRRDESDLPERWPVLVFGEDIGELSQKIEEHWKVLNELSKTDFFEHIQTQLDYNSRRIEAELQLEHIPPHDYEGFGKMHSSNNHWAGFYWRNNCYDIAFLEEVCRLCMRTNISRICLTPWKSFVVKEIQEKDLFHWHRLLGRFGINMRHSSFELNWHLPLRDAGAQRLKRFIVKTFDKVDVCVHGLTFGIKTKAEPMFSSIVVERKPGLRFLKWFDPFVTYRIMHAKNFNANTCQYEEYIPQVPRYHLPEVLQRITLKFYAQMQDGSIVQSSKPKLEKHPKHMVYQCPHCFAVYDEKVGDSLKGIPANTVFAELPESYGCPVCDAPKSEFKVIYMDHLVKG